LKISNERKSELMNETVSSAGSTILGYLLLLILLGMAFAYIMAFFGGGKEEKLRKENRDRRWGKIDRNHKTPSQIFPREVRNKVLNWTDGKCFHCEIDLQMESSQYWEIDHLWPKKFGGVDELFNLVASCKPCNSWKGGTEPFCAIVYKWGANKRISDFEMQFLKYYSKNSPVRLTTNPTWKSTLQTWPESINALARDLELYKQGKLSEKQRKRLYNRYIQIFSEF